MGKSRSPNYPALSLPEAIAKVRQVYNAEHRNRMSREAIAGVLGYEGLTGASVPVISALSKYGLTEGRGDDIRVSDDAVAILVDREGAPERVVAMKRAASAPKIFAELDKKFATIPSEDTVRIYLEKRQFTPDAARRVAKNYRATRELVNAETGSVSGVYGEEVIPSAEEPMETTTAAAAAASAFPPKPTPGIRQDVFTLSEGNVVISWPAALSEASFDLVRAWLPIMEMKVAAAAGLKVGRITSIVVEKDIEK